MEITPGFEKYVPTRLEWLASQLNSFSSYLDAQWDSRINKAYTPSSDGKTIILIIRHSKDIDNEDLEKFKDIAERNVTDLAEAYKWQSWVKVRVDCKPID